MDEIEFSYMGRGEGPDRQLEGFFDSLRDSQRLQVRTLAMDWARGRSELVKTALYHHGPDVSEVGTTWISDLIAMNALRPFTQAEVDQFGGADAFIPSAWQSTRIVGSPDVWSIPWLVESPVISYRRDALAAVGISETTAFSTLDSLYETVSRLRRAGHVLPIALPPPNSRQLILHYAATWVWQMGGDFLSEDGTSVQFIERQAMEGIKSYFRLARLIAPEGVQLLESQGMGGCFRQGRSPIAIGTNWLHPRAGDTPAFDLKHWGVARLPGPAFVGGSNLVLWKHTRQERGALALIRQLTGDEEARRYSEVCWMLPARASAFYDPEYQQDSYIRTASESLAVGRTFPNLPLWGLVEDRLVAALTLIWETLLKNPAASVDDTVNQSLTRLAKSLNITLSQR